MPRRAPARCLPALWPLAGVAAGLSGAAVFGGESGLCQASADRVGDLQDGNGGIELALGAIGKGDRDHVQDSGNEKGAEAPFRETHVGVGANASAGNQQWAVVVLMSHARPALPRATCCL